MNRYKYFLPFLMFLIFQGCFKCNDKPLNEVRVRILNDLNADIHTIMIGSTMYRGVDSYASCSMTEGFKDVKQGELTTYTTTYGNHMGYDGVRIEWRDDTRDALNASPFSKDDIEAELLRNGAIEDSVSNVYNGNMHYGLRLPDGDYTYKLKGIVERDNRAMEIEIIKDL